MTDEEQCNEILAQIDGAVVAFTLDRGEPWVKKDWIVRIPEAQFAIVRKYHEWTREPKPGSNRLGQTEQIVDLGKYNIGPTKLAVGVHIVSRWDGGSNFQAMNEMLKKAYMPALKDMLDNQSALLKMIDKE